MGLKIMKLLKQKLWLYSICLHNCKRKWRTSTSNRFGYHSALVIWLSLFVSLYSDYNLRWISQKDDEILDYILVKDSSINSCSKFETNCSVWRWLMASFGADWQFWLFSIGFSVRDCCFLEDKAMPSYFLENVFRQPPLCLSYMYYFCIDLTWPAPIL